MSEVEHNMAHVLADRAEFTCEDVPHESDLPTLAEQRHEEAQAKVREVDSAVRELLGAGMITAIGYRVMVKPVESIRTLEAAEAEVAPTLHAEGFEVKSEAEKVREERGENIGVVITMGDCAFERIGGRAAWCEVGDTVIFSRYAGTRVEHPPKSGNFYQIMNDEDIFGKVV